MPSSLLDWQPVGVIAGDHQLATFLRQRGVSTHGRRNANALGLNRVYVCRRARSLQCPYKINVFSHTGSQRHEVFELHAHQHGDDGRIDYVQLDAQQLAVTILPFPPVEPDLLNIRYAPDNKSRYRNKEPAWLPGIIRSRRTQLLVKCMKKRGKLQGGSANRTGGRAEDLATAAWMVARRKVKDGLDRIEELTEVLAETEYSHVASSISFILQHDLAPFIEYIGGFHCACCSRRPNSNYGTNKARPSKQTLAKLQAHRRRMQMDRLRRNEGRRAGRSRSPAVRRRSKRTLSDDDEEEEAEQTRDASVKMENEFHDGDHGADASTSNTVDAVDVVAGAAADDADRSYDDNSMSGQNNNRTSGGRQPSAMADRYVSVIVDGDDEEDDDEVEDDPGEGNSSRRDANERGEGEEEEEEEEEDDDIAEIEPDSDDDVALSKRVRRRRAARGAARRPRRDAAGTNQVWHEKLELSESQLVEYAADNTITLRRPLDVPKTGGQVYKRCRYTDRRHCEFRVRIHYDTERDLYVVQSKGTHCNHDLSRPSGDGSGGVLTDAQKHCAEFAFMYNSLRTTPAALRLLHKLQWPAPAKGTLGYYLVRLKQRWRERPDDPALEQRRRDSERFVRQRIEQLNMDYEELVRELKFAVVVDVPTADTAEADSARVVPVRTGGLFDPSTGNISSTSSSRLPWNYVTTLDADGYGRFMQSRHDQLSQTTTYGSVTGSETLVFVCKHTRKHKCPYRMQVIVSCDRRDYRVSEFGEHDHSTSVQYIPLTPEQKECADEAVHADRDAAYARELMALRGLPFPQTTKLNNYICKVRLRLGKTGPNACTRHYRPQELSAEQRLHADNAGRRGGGPSLAAQMMRAAGVQPPSMMSIRVYMKKAFPPQGRKRDRERQERLAAAVAKQQEALEQAEQHQQHLADDNRIKAQADVNVDMLSDNQQCSSAMDAAASHAAVMRAQQQPPQHRPPCDDRASHAGVAAHAVPSSAQHALPASQPQMTVRWPAVAVLTAGGGAPYNVDLNNVAYAGGAVTLAAGPYPGAGADSSTGGGAPAHFYATADVNAVQFLSVSLRATQQQQQHGQPQPPQQQQHGQQRQ